MNDQNDDNIRSSNPFTGTYTVNIIRTFILPSPSETTIDVSQNPTFFDMESQGRTTIYKDTDIAIKLCREAKPTTLKLFLYIVYELLKKDRDFIDLKISETQSRLDVSRASLYYAIAELEKYRIIAKKLGKNQYWVNTLYMFNGNRIDYIKMNAPQTLNITYTRTVQG